MLLYHSFNTDDIKTIYTPEELEELKNETIVDIRFEMKSFKEIQCLTKLPLNTLYLNDVQITSFKGFPNLPNLTRLHIRHSQLNSFKHFPNLPNLLHLTINHSSKLTSFEYFPNSSKLNYLILYYNRISSFKHFPNLPNLYLLDLNHNDITSFEHFPNLLNLYNLDVTSNYITSFEHFPELPKLHYLYIASNYIKNFNHFEHKVPTISILDVSYNGDLRTFELPQLKWDRLISLNIRKVGFNSLDFLSTMPSLKSMDISSGDIDYFKTLSVSSNLKSVIIYYWYYPINVEESIKEANSKIIKEKLQNVNDVCHTTYYHYDHPYY